MHFSCRSAFYGLTLAFASISTLPSSLVCVAQERAAANAVDSPVAAARQFLDGLNDKQRERAHFEFDDERRTQWHFVPMATRKGLALRDMSEEQIQSALKLLQTLVSKEGYQRVSDIMSYEGILLELEGPDQAERRNNKKFYVGIYGEPTNESEWGFSFEGHHVSLNFTIANGKVVDSTPQFFGANPAELRRAFTVPMVALSGKEVTFPQGKKIFAVEETAGFALLDSLNDAQKEKATFNTKCPEDIVWAGQAQPNPGQPVGIRGVDLDVDQKKLLMSLIESLQHTLPQEVAQSRLNLITASGVDSVYFGWAGEKSRNGQHYYRLQGPTFFVEYCNFQEDPNGNTANHIHWIWRDLTGDFNLPIAVSKK